jgi:glycine betaine/proline transport system ATP-binding protein
MNFSAWPVFHSTSSGHSSLKISENGSKNDVTASAVSLRNVWKIFGDRSDEAMRAIASEGLGKQDVLRRFGCVIGVADVSFDVARGEIFCIMGLSGSGKSTLVRHVNRLIEPTSGHISIAGTDVGSLGPEALRALRAAGIGMVFQNMALMPHMTVRENVALALELRGADGYERHQVADRMIDTVSLTGYGDRFPDELSGGMQQRVGLARALAADPQLLLMDEPFSALDPLIRRQLQYEFLRLSATLHKTTLFITHDLDEAIRMGDRIAIMRDGRIVQIGTPEDIVTQPSDDYVAEFVKGISRLKLVSAAKVMRPIDAGASGLDGAPSATPQTDLNGLIDLAIESDRPIVVRQDGRAVGLIDRTDLLRAIQGGRP